MPFEARKFIFTVSLCAMLAVNPVLATAPGENESVGSAHEVYVESNLNKATNGIAGVGYVNRMIDAAGNAAQQAENHAAAAGAHAQSAAQSATEAHEVLADKVNIDQGADDKNKAMVTDDKGSVYPGYISTDMITKGEDATVLLVQSTGTNARAAWGKIDSEYISGGAVTTDKIADRAVTRDKIAPGAVTPDRISADAGSGDFYTGFLYADQYGVVGWQRIRTEDILNGTVTSGKIADGAVTTEKIANAAVTADKIADRAVTLDKIMLAPPSSYSPSSGFVMVSYSGRMGPVNEWGRVRRIMIEPHAVGQDEIDYDAIYSRHIVDGAVTTDKIGNVDGNGGYVAGVMISRGESGVTWSKVESKDIANGAVRMENIYTGAVTTAAIADGAVKREKTEGIVGVIPVGSATDPTSYGSFWVE